MTLTLKTGNARAPLAERGNDLYETPPVAVDALVRAEGDRLPKWLWEPACGPGNIVRTLRAHGREVWATDLIDYASPDQDESRFDFLMPNHGGRALVEGIVTNPPFKLANEFVSRAIDLAPYVAMLLRLAFLESERRSPILDNGTLARVHLFRKRLPMMHRAGWDGKKGSSGMAFAWFVWERGHAGPTTLHRISWDRGE